MLGDPSPRTWDELVGDLVPPHEERPGSRIMEETARYAHRIKQLITDKGQRVVINYPLGYVICQLLYFLYAQSIYYIVGFTCTHLFYYFHKA